MYKIKKIVIVNLVLFALLFSASSYSQVNKKADSFDYELKNLSISEVCSLINKNSSDNKAKVKFLFNWVKRNIKYDLEKYNKIVDGRNSAIIFQSDDPELILIKKKGICSDFSRLVKKVMDSLHIPCIVINGFAKGDQSHLASDSSKILHSWNAIFFDDEWKLFDFTWASIYETSGLKSDFFFDAPPEKFIFTHFPYEQKWTLLNKTISKEDFFNNSLVQWNYLEDFNPIDVNLPFKRIGNSIQFKISFSLADSFSIEYYSVNDLYLGELEFELIKVENSIYYYSIKLPITNEKSYFININKAIPHEGYRGANRLLPVIIFLIDRNY